MISFITLGTLGDVLPHVCMAEQLRKQGQEVTVFGPSRYAYLGVEPITDEWIFDDPTLWQKGQMQRVMDYFKSVKCPSVEGQVFRHPLLDCAGTPIYTSPAMREVSVEPGLCLWPSWFAPAIGAHAGFKFYDPPIYWEPELDKDTYVVMFGSSMVDTSKIVAQVEAQGFKAYVPDTFVPIRHYYGKVAGIIHHGGIGTCAQALRGRMKQHIVPLAFDQFENARLMHEHGLATVHEIDAVTL